MRKTLENVWIKHPRLKVPTLIIAWSTLYICSWTKYTNLYDDREWMPAWHSIGKSIDDIYEITLYINRSWIRG